MRQRKTVVANHDRKPRRAVMPRSRTGMRTVSGSRTNTGTAGVPTPFGLVVVFLLRRLLGISRPWAKCGRILPWSASISS